MKQGSPVLSNNGGCTCHLFSSFYVINWWVKPKKFQIGFLKYPFETDCFISNQCSSTGKPDCKNLQPRDPPGHSRRAVLTLKCWQKTKQQLMASVCFSCGYKASSFFSSLFCRATTPAAGTTFCFPVARNQNSRLVVSIGWVGCSALMVSFSLPVLEAAEYCPCYGREERWQIYPTGLVLRGVNRWLHV